jgi:hypothetical protein
MIIHMKINIGTLIKLYLKYLLEGILLCNSVLFLAVMLVVAVSVVDS